LKNKIHLSVIDYGMGNQGSLVNCLRSMNYRVSIAKHPKELDKSDITVLPGVGAFPEAMKNLNKNGFSDYLKERSNKKNPIIGICLGMQLLAEGSYENYYSDGLGIIPGKVKRIPNHDWHIGWNQLSFTKASFLSKFSNKNFYFNHSYEFIGEERYTVANSRKPYECSAIIRRGSSIGIQFHPEKSQQVGKDLLSCVISSF